MVKGSENQIVQFLLLDGKIKGALVSGKNLVECAKSSHNLGPTETLILGQALLAGALLTTTIKGEDRLNLNVECGGPIGGINVDCNALGDVRGSILNNPILAAADRAVTLDNLFGPGFLHITRKSEGAKTPFTGSVELRYPDLASNLAYYFTTSEQTPSAFFFSLDFDTNANFNDAVALFLQVLPGADDKILEELEANIDSFRESKKSIVSEIDKSGDAVEWLTKFFGAYDFKAVGLKSVRFLCPCSREQISAFLKGFDEKKAGSLKEGEGELKITCHGCGTVYSFSDEELKEILGE